MRSAQRRPRHIASYGVRYLVLVMVSIPFLGPLLWMLSGSLKGPNEVLRYPPSLIPEVVRWSNYVRVFEFQPFGRQLLNSITVMLVVCAITVVVSTMAGYAFARIRFRWSSILFIVCLSGIFVPPEATIIPLFRLASQLGWIDSLLPLIIFTAFLATCPLGTFVMRQAFVALPGEFEEAATVDGASQARVLLRIYVPMAWPSVSAIIVFSAWYSWNQFLEPLVYLRSQSAFTAPLALTHYEDPFAGPLWGVQMAATTLSVIPVLIVFLVAQRYVISGLAAGGLKS